MCGIAGIYLKNPSVVKRHVGMEHLANLLLLGIESRGKDATGFVSHKPGGKALTLDKQPITASDFIKRRLPIPEGANVWLGHTRLPTKGDKEQKENNHPVVCNSTFVIHNGSIYNDDELFKEHKCERGAEVDSQAIAMLIDKFGFDKAEEALAQMKGAFAIAAIDPVRNPDQVLLAKGGWSPLVYHESDHFVIWASTYTAIRDAWKVVLGTPPSYKTFKDLNEGDILVLSKEGIEKRKFERPEDFGQRKSRTTTTGTRGNDGARASGTGTTYRSPRTVQHPAISGAERRAGTRGATTSASRELVPNRYGVEVTQKRHAGLGLAREFEKYEEGEYDLKIFEKAAYPLNWEWCDGCMTCILKDDMQDTANWGRICDDCYDVCLQTLGYKDDVSDDNVIHEVGILSEENLNTIDNWAKMELEVHWKALADVQEQTGMDSQTIDFLIFRCPEPYLDSQPDMKELVEALDDAYQEAMDKRWADFGVGDAANLRATPSPDSERPSLRSLPPPPSGSRLAPNSTRWDDPGVTRCTTHQTTFPKSQECHECIKDFLRSKKPDLTITSCKVCKHATKFHMLKWAWCNKHYNICNLCEDGQGVEANATLPDGTRVCHQHGRGRKGLLYDGKDGKNLVLLGIEVAERTTPE